MRKLLTLFGATALLVPDATVLAQTKVYDAPPVAPLRPVTDDYYGSKIVDNYRYMENLKDPEVQEWFKNQNDYTRATLASIPGRAKFLARIGELDRSDVVIIGDVTRRPGELYFYTKLFGTDDVSKLYIRRGLTGEEKLLVDPETIPLSASNQGKGKNAISEFTLSQDCRYIAVGVIPGGSENDTEIHVIDVATGRETGDVILRVLGGVMGWLPDNRSFVYSRLQDLPSGAPPTELRQKQRIYLHVLGTDPQKDPPVFGYGVVPSIEVDPNQFTGIWITPNSDQVLASVRSGVARESFFYIEPSEALGKSNTAWRKFADTSDKISRVAVHGDDLYLLTFRNASHYKILRTSARNPDLPSAEVVIPPGEAIIRSMHVAHDALYVHVVDGGLGRILRVPFGAKPKVETVPLPFEGAADVEDTDSRLPGFVLGLTSWTVAEHNYVYDPHTRRLTETKFRPVGPHDRDNNEEAVQVKVRSYDGTLVPLSIVFPKGLKLDGSNPTDLHGYGAYGSSSSSPNYDPVSLAWSEKGGIYAICGVRGGGEYGEEWHLAGKGATKSNSWRDFIACAEYLIDQKYTSAKYLAARGESAGGILVGRAITERPDLFAAAIIQVGALDMLRFETEANGPGNIPEFGSTRTEEGFKALYAMSAYHHVKDNAPYPAVLLTTGMNDPRVEPWEPGKMAARLQAATSSGKPILLSVDYESGHMSSTEKGFEESYADGVSFMLWQFGDPDFQPKKHP